MLLNRFRRRKSVVERIEQYTAKPNCRCSKAPTIQTITVTLPATVDGALLAHQIEHQLKRRGHA